MKYVFLERKLVAEGKCQRGGAPAGRCGSPGVTASPASSLSLLCHGLCCPQLGTTAAVRLDDTATSGEVCHSGRYRCFSVLLSMKGASCQPCSRSCRQMAAGAVWAA